MRISNRMMIDTAIRQMNDSKEQLAALQEIAGSGKLFQNISDDPSRASFAQGLRSSLKTNEGFINTGQNASDWLSGNEQVFGQMIDIGTKVQNLLLQGSSDTLSSTERAALGTQVNDLLKEAVDQANSNVNGRFLFSGFQVKTIPFTLNAGGTAVTYNGDSGIIQQDINLGQKIDLGFDGSATFSSFFQSLIDARDALLTNNMPNLATAQGAFTNALAAVQTARTVNGTRQQQVTATLDSLGKAQTQIKALLSKKEDANMAEAISNLNSQQTIYQTVIEVSSRAISSLNLFDSLR
ncbi:MAG TPA: flagellar hook-associated protein FlgL [Anaerolineaceae bacterium]|nr:flagellar hook-associated protein FlgL [Anaerolineaceae bacterium]